MEPPVVRTSRRSCAEAPFRRRTVSWRDRVDAAMRGAQIASLKLVKLKSRTFSGGTTIA